MVGITISLIVVGLILVAVSFFESDKFKESLKTAESNDSVVALWSEKEEAIIMERVQKILDEKRESIVQKAEDELSYMCNEKIMSFDEFSSQIIERIEQNNNEVVFLYNMLVEKKEELKSFVSDIMIKESISRQEVKEETKDLNQATAIERLMKNKQDVTTSRPTDQESNVIFASSSTRAGIKAETVNNRNEKILSLHKKGVSNLEISKQLGIGQGEVKLVIDLFLGKKR